MAILGIDEVGRGPLAGPLVVGAVVLPDAVNGVRPEWIANLKDSKKLSVKKREALSEVIWREAPAVGLGWVTPRELDEAGIPEALRLATRRAVKAVQGMGVAFSQIVIDGKVNFLSGTTLSEYVSVMPKADDLIKEVSAASIVAKVARDEYMREAGVRFPEYGFEKHAGYGTVAHREAISRYGICEEHRRSFEPVRSMVGFSRSSSGGDGVGGACGVSAGSGGGDSGGGRGDSGASVVKNTTMVGRRGEDAAAEYLAKRGHEIVARNFKTYFYEIDIVSVCEGRIYFTEVKYRRSSARGGGIAAVDGRKLKQMRFAAECFLKYYKREFGALDPLLAVADVTGEGFEVKDWVVVR